MTGNPNLMDDISVYRVKKNKFEDSINKCDWVRNTDLDDMKRTLRLNICTIEINGKPSNFHYGFTIIWTL